MERIREISEHTAKAMMCEVDCDIRPLYPPTINHATEAEHIRRLAEKWFGPEHTTDHDLPMTASEDFSYFLLEKPGCFFMLGTLKPGAVPTTLHTSDYNFNDDVLASGGYFWVRLVEDRLGVSLI